MSSALLCC